MTGLAEERLAQPQSRSEWRAWLAEHADDGGGVWLVLQKGHDAPLTYEEAVEEALAVGWIDGRTNRHDAERYKIWIAPRKKGSGWASSNKQRVAGLMEKGLMTPRGLAVVDAAKADGSWHALDGVMALEVPPDLGEALGLDQAAAENFERFSPSARRMILEWLRQAKRTDTRRRRVADVVRAAAINEKPGPWRPRNGV
jgi:uncharacterized protein YdeI (YjbR/CyaY-like superfamily)